MAELSFRTHSAALAAVTDLFQQRVEALSIGSLRQLALALQRPQADAEEIVRAVVAAARDGSPRRTLEGGGLGQLLTLDEGRERIDAIAVDVEPAEWAASVLLGAGDAAARIGVSRAALDNWRRAHRVLAFRRGIRNFVYPVRQFERQRPIDGLDQVRAHFDDDETAWEWLIVENAHTGDAAPIERLRNGRVEEVVRAAEGALDFQ